MADIDSRIALAEELIRKRREIDEQLEALFSGEAATKKGRKCSVCGQEGHQARTCPQAERPNGATIS